jgi:methyltransferase (TIGR00027 family)
MAERPAKRLSSGQPSATAEINAQMRAADATLSPGHRLVGDPYARYFVSNPRYRLLRLTPKVALAGLVGFDRLFGGMLAEILLRGRYVDEVLADRYFRADVRQTVLIGAGYDATALRHPVLRDMRWFEVDHPATQQAKRAALRRIGIKADNVVFAAADLGRDPLLDRLKETGFDIAEPGLVAWLGVSYYLGDEAFRRALADIAEVCAPGSTLVFDYMDASVINGTTHFQGARRAARSVQRRGEPYVLGMSEEEAFQAAEEAGFERVEALRVTDLVRRYGGRRPYCRPDDYMGVVTVRRR